MGWRGTLRSINAEINRQERLEAKRQRAQQKQNEIHSAYRKVAYQEQLLDDVVSLHHDCEAHMDWAAIKAEPRPMPPELVTFRQEDVEKKLEKLRPCFFDKIISTIAWRRRRLEKALKRAKREDTEEYNLRFKKYREHEAQWLVHQDLAKGVFSADGKAYIKVIEMFGNLKNLKAGKGVELNADEVGRLSFDLKVLPREEVIPDEEYSLRDSGTLSTKRMPKTKGIDIYQDHVCSCLLRIARELFGLLPILEVQANAVLKMLDTKTGYLNDQVIVSALIKRNTLDSLNLRAVDPSDCFENFITNMKFFKSKGFSPVERVPYV